MRHDWVYFVDADEWVSPQLAQEIAAQLTAPSCAGFTHRLRLVFQGTWIRHCGWYKGSWVVRLVDRRHTKYDGRPVGERACVDGPIQRLHNDIVDEDRKAFASWLYKHVGYAQLEAECRAKRARVRQRLSVLRSREDSRPLARAVVKDVFFPAVPAKPLVLFLYMFFVKLGFLDGPMGLRFCFYHAWYEACIASIQADRAATE